MTALPGLLASLLMSTALAAGAAHAVPRGKVASDCAALQARAPAPVTGKSTAVAAKTARPAKGLPRLDPAFGTCVVRATDHAAEPPADFARSDYSRRQAFNADDTRFIVYASGGAWHLYDANTLAYLRQLKGPAGDAEPQWDATQPGKLYYTPNNGGMQLHALDVESNRSTVAADFTGRLPWPRTARVLTRSEGSPSADSRYWCFLATTDKFDILGVFTYDLREQAVLGSRALAVMPDHVSMSPSGRHCVVSHDHRSGGTVAWDRGFRKSRQLHATSEHSDLAIGSNRNDVFVFVDFQSNGGDLVMVDVDTGKRSTLFPTYVDGSTTSYHVSGKAYGRPGWVLVSTYGHRGARRWLHEQVMAVELAPDPTIVNLAHHHARDMGYWTEPHATVNRDFTRVLFNSNWDKASKLDVDAYMILVPPTFLR